MTDEQHSRLNELVSEYAIGALDADERAEFEAHLATCEECQAELAELSDVTAALSQLVAHEPPPTLRASVLSTIANTPQVDATGAGRHADQSASERVGVADDAPHGQHLRSASAPTDPPAAAGPDNVVPMRSKANKATGLLAAAAVVAALAMGAWAMESRNDAQEAASQTQQLTQILGAPDVETVTGKFTAGGHGTLVVSDSSDQALLVGSDLPKLPDGKVYQAWTITDAAASAGTFSPDGDQTVVTLPDAALTAKVVAVTVEDRGGAKQPSTDPIFMVNVPT